MIRVRKKVDEKLSKREVEISSESIMYRRDLCGSGVGMIIIMESDNAQNKCKGEDKSKQKDMQKDQG